MSRPLALFGGLWRWKGRDILFHLGECVCHVVMMLDFLLVVNSFGDVIPIIIMSRNRGIFVSLRLIREWNVTG